MHDRHTFTPRRAAPRRVHMGCTGCSKSKWVSTTPCEPCNKRARAYQELTLLRAGVLMRMSAQERANQPMPEPFENGCDRCYKGHIIPHWEPACCCGRLGYDDRCKGCKAACDLDNPDQVHHCEVPSDEEIDHELAVAMMDSPKQGPSTVDHLTAPLEMPSRN